MSTAFVLSRGLQERLNSARQLTDSIFGLLRPGALYARPIPERHRLVFYLGHLEAFDWNLIARKALERHPSIRSSTRCSNSASIRRWGKLLPISPPIGLVSKKFRTYNRRVRSRIDELLDHAPEQIIHVALEHRLMHAETLAYLLHNLPYDQKIRN